MKEHKVNKNFNFIAGWYAEDTYICDELIDHYNKSNFKKPGMVSGIQNDKVKKSTDCPIEDFELYSRYLKFLANTVNNYKELYPKCVEHNYNWGLVEKPQIQHYKPSEGFLGWHNERSSHMYPLGSRHLVFMTYLNTVEDKGGTEFYHQNITIKAEKGLTLVWPTDWPFTHRGVPSPSENKYIVTGWLSFKDPKPINWS